MRVHCVLQIQMTRSRKVTVTHSPKLKIYLTNSYRWYRKV
jgi:hypothetical protein